MRDLPVDPLGDGPLPQWARQLGRFLNRYTVVGVTGALRVPQANGGVVWQLPSAIAGVMAGASVSQFAVQSEQPLTITCKAWVNGAASGPDVVVNKPENLQNVAWTTNQYGLQFSWQPLVISGVTSANKRQSTIGTFAAPGTIWNEVIYPGYTGSTPSLIWAVQLPAQVNGSNWIDLNIGGNGAGRKWMKEVTVCVDAEGNTIALGLVDASATYQTASAIDFTTV